MIVLWDLEQLTDEWFAEKAGTPGASSFKKIVTTKGEPSKQAEEYMEKLAAEAITGQCHDRDLSHLKAIKDGLEREPESLALYEIINDVEVKKAGLIYPDEQKKYHISPDGLIESDAKWGLEMKNPFPKTQIKYLKENRLPPEYFQQVQGSMLATGYDRWDFFSYVPGLPAFRVKCHPDEKFLKKLEKALDDFCLELSILIRKIKEM